MPVGIWLRFQEELESITQVLCTTFAIQGAGNLTAAVSVRLILAFRGHPY